MSPLYQSHVERAEELLAQAKKYEAKAAAYLYDAVVAITQAIIQLEKARDEQ